MTDQDKKEKLQGIDKEISDKTLSLAKLTAEIKSREKLLEELNKTKSPNQETVIEALHRQEDEILLRDKQIIVLNERISFLEKGEFAKLFTEKDRQINELKSQLEATSKELAEEQDYEHQLNEEKLKLARRDHEYKELQEAFHKLEEQLHAHKEALNDQKPEEIQPAEPEQKHDYEAEIKALKEKINELQIEINIGDERNEKLNEKILQFKKKKKEKDNELREMEEKFETVQIKYSETLQELDQIRKSQPPTQADISHRVSVQAEVDQGANEKLQQLQSEVHKLQDQIKEKDAEIKKLHEKLDHAHKEIEARDKTIQDLQHKTNKQADHSAKSGDLHNELKNIVEDKNREIERLQHLLESSESQNDDKMTLLIQQEKKLRELEDTNSKLEELTIGLKEGLSQIQEKILMTGDQMADLKQALSESEHQLREARQEKNNMQKKLKDTLLDNNDMKSIIGFKEAEINKKDQAAIKMMEEINLLRQRVKQASVKLNSIVDQQLKEHERKMKEKDTEIGVLKEMLKSSKTMLRYKEVELDKIKKQFMSSDGDVKLPKINQSPQKGFSQIKNDFSLQNLNPGKVESLHSAKSNQFNQSKNIGVNSPGFNDGRSHNELPYIPSNEQGSFFSNKNDKNKILPSPRELDDTSTYEGERPSDTEKKAKKKTNNIFDPNADVDFKPGDVKISPVKVTKKKKPEVSRTEDAVTPRQENLPKTPKETSTVNSKKLDEEEKPKPPAEKKGKPSAKDEQVKKASKKKTVTSEEAASEEQEEKDEEDEDEEKEDEEKDDEEGDGEGDEKDEEEGEEEEEEGDRKDKDEEEEEEDDKE